MGRLRHINIFGYLGQIFGKRKPTGWRTENFSLRYQGSIGLSWLVMILRAIQRFPSSFSRLAWKFPGSSPEVNPCLWYGSHRSPELTSFSDLRAISQKPFLALGRAIVCLTHAWFATASASYRIEKLQNQNPENRSKKGNKRTLPYFSNVLPTFLQFSVFLGRKRLSLSTGCPSGGGF